jgi:hypothetical protein
MAMKIRIKSYTGCKADKRPAIFYLGERRLGVTELLDRWYGEDYDYFKLLADDGNMYILKYYRPHDHWELILYSASSLPPWVKDPEIDLRPTVKNRRYRLLN